MRLRFLPSFLILLASSAVVVGALPSRPDGYVTDAASLLRPATKQAIEAAAAELDAKTGSQVAVVTIPSLEGDTIDGAAVKLFQAWGVGRKKEDDGVLFLISSGDRKARIEVGYGLEGVLPDARAGRILDTEAIPAFRAGDYDAGIARASYVLMTQIAAARGVELTGAQPPASRRASPLSLLLFLIIFGVIAFQNPWILLLLGSGRGHRGGWGGGGGGFGGFGGFGGGSSGGGGASRGW